MPPHRADVATDRVVVEFQNSPISEEEAVERTLFYKEHRKLMRWVVNGRNFENNVEICPLESEEKNAHFRWKDPKPCWTVVRKLGAVVLFDFAAGFVVGADCGDDGTFWSGWWGSKTSFVEKSL